MPKHGVEGIVFSSSCTVYGQPDELPVTEKAPIKKAESPYGNTKQINEEIIRDTVASGAPINAIMLRYFNPIGAHKSGLIGENPNGIPNNLMPYITQVAVGKLKELGVFGDDYDTPDGTGVRDYIHVVDLAKGHVKALKKLEDHSGLNIYNLGTGTRLQRAGYREKLRGCYRREDPVCDQAPPCPGDVATCYSDASKAERELGWKAEYGIKEMCEDSWRWQSMNPNGYDD